MSTIQLTVTRRGSAPVDSVLTLFNETDLVNLVAYGTGSTFTSPNGPESHVEVAETPAEILTLIGFIPDVTADTIYKVKVTIPSETFKTMFATPIEAIEAPGAGKTIDVLSAYGLITYGTTAYDTAAALYLHYESNVGTGTSIVGALTTVLTQATATKRQKAALTANALVFSNKGIYLAVPTADPTLGDSVIDVYISYRVVTE